MKDIIYVERKYFLTVKGESIKFVNVMDKTEKYIPLDDVEWLIFDHPSSYFSNKLITECMVRGIGVLFCDGKHSPDAILLNQFGHRQRLTRVNHQLSVSNRTKKRLWKKIIRTKIHNQAQCIDQLTDNQKSRDYLMSLSNSVQEGDSSNREAVAAKIYFTALFGENFRRGRYDDVVNSGLNYGYALVRGMIKKELARYGVEQSFGIHHKSSENPFNLADDIIEPFRPFVDRSVYENFYLTEKTTFEHTDKQALFQVFFDSCIIQGKVFQLTDAINQAVQSFVKSIDQNSATALTVPQFVEVGR
ncbi:type II CRISPR-associated endonuclease Cas1 [Enterococcus italicus]|uniref:CRISPR-associated endonuclease Cas1 n=1 Tax=Enterococcus italicus (strain DSM 15952 / CCUG 50447 / LMG 22039 / TP 1.5) TaxID=888064 RepID=E6LHV9_ENTI1|nr:type II CRISPR-associated endonuclease Cas1 [Enterococcus italicus]EFU73219.1 CRISPR-associated endonuclease Cas1, NMENI subtype [Enterococcus italicus DSM 15952]MCM6880184.1 type II CRISPR-associated endonuclease Cas1 [Enterococcus italicus]OJG60137.1 CRISPR-associated protein Cas1 [Enterococcus italicus DSM 15952]